MVSPPGSVSTSAAGFGTAWFKSSFSNDGPNCVEVRIDSSEVHIRDSKYLRDPANLPANQPTISVPVSTWEAFLTAVLSPEDGAHTSVEIDRISTGGAVLRTDEVSLRFTAAEWTAFVAGVANCEFNL